MEASSSSSTSTKKIKKKNKNKEGKLSLNVERHKVEFIPFIEALTKALTDKECRKLPTLAPQVNKGTKIGADGWIEVKIKTSLNKCRLKIRKENAFADAFIYPHMLKFAEFKPDKDCFQNFDSDLLIFTGSYLDIGAFAGKKLQDITFTLQKVIQAVNDLAKPKPKEEDYKTKEQFGKAKKQYTETLAMSLLIIIVYVCESVRLTEVFDKFKDEKFSGTLTQEMIMLINCWSVLSRDVQVKNAEGNDYLNDDTSIKETRKQLRIMLSLERKDNNKEPTSKRSKYPLHSNAKIKSKPRR